MSHQSNLERIKTVFESLGDLQGQAVFVGGATISLYDESPAFEVRETKDIDVIIEIASYPEHVAFEERLRLKGFTDDVHSKVRGRFIIKGITVDVIPTRDVNLGFENKWYPEGFKRSVDFEIDENTRVKILYAPYFIATKLEAFKNRGRNDGRTSHDFEDIVHVLEYRISVWEEIRKASADLQSYLISEFATLLGQPYIEEWIDSHVDFQSPPSTIFILDEIKKLAN